MEFIVLIIQVAAVVEFNNRFPEQAKCYAQRDTLRYTIGRIWCDNKAAIKWCNALTTASSSGQNLIWILAEILRIHEFGINADHIAGVDNTLADYISRPLNLTLSHHSRCAQIYQKHGMLRTYSYFRPSREFLQMLSCYLCTKVDLGRPEIPSSFGQFEAAVSTFSMSPML